MSTIETLVLALVSLLKQSVTSDLAKNLSLVNALVDKFNDNLRTTAKLLTDDYYKTLCVSKSFDLAKKDTKHVKSFGFTLKCADGLVNAFVLSVSGISVNYFSGKLVSANKGSACSFVNLGRKHSERTFEYDETFAATVNKACDDYVKAMSITATNFDNLSAKYTKAIVNNLCKVVVKLDPAQKETVAEIKKALN